MTKTSMQFVDQDLYGGAIVTKVPKGLLDASNFREIPDTQEVFVNSSSNQEDVSQLFKDDSIIIDLLERVEGTNDECINTHLAEMNSFNNVEENELVILSNQQIELKDFKNDAAFIITCAEPSRKWGRTDNENILFFVLGLIRIAKVETDLLITLNCPISLSKFEKQASNLEANELNPASDLAKKIRAAQNVVKEALTNLKIKNWDLFG